MTHFKVVISLVLLSSQALFSQSNSRVDVAKKLKEADTVLLISHKAVAGSTDMFVDSTGKMISLQPLVIGSKVNEAVILKRVALPKNSLFVLSNILSRRYIPRSTCQAGCFTSHHAIILIKNRRASFIDLCFRCSHYETSEDLESIYVLDRSKWKALKAIFKKVGFSLIEEDTIE